VSLICAAVVVACSDDDEDNPTAPVNLCDQENTSCVSLTLDGSAVIYESTYDASYNETGHALQWNVANQTLSDYGPGQRIHIEITFSPPLRVRYYHPLQAFNLYVGTPLVCTDRYVLPTETFTHAGWNNAMNVVACNGSCYNDASSVGLGASFAPLTPGAELSHMSFDFVVPETYTEGTEIGTDVIPGDLPFHGLWFYARIAGDNPGDPPIWPGEYTP